MIARDSKSYPYLAIAQHYGVDYGEVLKLADMCPFPVVFGIDWMDAVQDAHCDEQIRRGYEIQN